MTNATGIIYAPDADPQVLVTWGDWVDTGVPEDNWIPFTLTTIPFPVPGMSLGPNGGQLVRVRLWREALQVPDTATISDRDDSGTKGTLHLGATHTYILESDDQGIISYAVWRQNANASEKYWLEIRMMDGIEMPNYGPQETTFGF